MNFKTSALLGAAVLALAACGKKEAKTEPAKAPETAATSASEATPPAATGATEIPASAAENLAASKKFLAENAAKSGVKTTASGLQYEVLRQGPAGGYSPKSTDLVTVHYVGTTIDGTEFDSSRARGAAARFPLNAVIPGWTEGVQLMKEGDRFRFAIPSALAYGDKGVPGGPIGPNQALIFDVELLKVANPERALAASAKWLADNAKKPGVKSTASGLQYEVVSKGGGGKKPIADNVVRVHYKGTLTDGTEFDSSYARGEPAEFPLAGVIPGWTEGVQLMNAGDKFRFYIPPTLGYGEQGTPDGAIGPNEALVFEVELLEVK
jgi:peptidylprolyl isomerase